VVPPQLTASAVHSLTDTGQAVRFGALESKTATDIRFPLTVESPASSTEVNQSDSPVREATPGAILRLRGHRLSPNPIL